MFSVGVSDHIMIAHSLPGEVFGPAQRLHGATYEVRAELCATELDHNGIVVDIGLFRSALRETLAPLDYQNLDELPLFRDRISTTEELCRIIHGELARRLGGRAGAELSITLVESPVAWASYRASLEPDS
jgi:6-pyruvoyltetrahydropterin/6-carboxytetrahydropterin synthase